MTKPGDEGGPTRRPRSNLQVRAVSALVLGSVVLLITYLGGLPFRLMAAVMAGAILYEWLAMRPGSKTGVHATIAIGLLAVVMAMMILGLSAGAVFLALAGILVVLALHGWASGEGLGTTAGVAYAAAPAIALVHLRADDQSGFLAILFLFAVVWTSDIMAYFTGRSLGGPKLAPSISPGKTWSGAIGGAAFAVVAGAAFAMHESTVHGVVLLALIALVLSVISQLGDLFESALKRRSGVKDSSNLIPGHGGVMDRVDGLMAAALALYLVAALLGSPEMPAHAFFRF